MESKEDLVIRARNGDADAFAVLYQDVYKDLYNMALYTLRSSQDAEDAVSETVLDAYRSMYKLRDANAFRGWIFKILSNKCKGRIREYKKSWEPLREEIPDDRQKIYEYAGLLDCMKNLSKEERMIVSMSVFGGYKGEEISHILHKKHSTVRSKYRRALLKLKQCLEYEAE